MAEISSTRVLDPVESPRLRLTGVTRRYGAMAAVDGVDLAVRQGELVALLGPSGCGKTTTLRLIAGFESPDAGSIEIAGQQVAGDRKFTPPEKRRVGMVFQDYALFPHLSVGQNVAFGIARSSSRREQVADALAQVGLDGLEDRMPNQLSGGQQQRVALARALAPRPDLILLDEPFSNLDPHLRAQVRSEVREILSRAGATAVLVTHDQEEALSLADRIAVMFEGRVAQLDTPETIYHRPGSREVARFIGDESMIPGVANGKMVETIFGPLPLANDLSGAVDVMIRPELIRLATVAGTAATVIGRVFTGRDLLVTLELASDQRVAARFDNRSGWQVGDSVNVEVDGPVVAFSATRSGAHAPIGRAAHPGSSTNPE